MLNWEISYTDESILLLLLSFKIINLTFFNEVLNLNIICCRLLLWTFFFLSSRGICISEPCFLQQVLNLNIIYCRLLLLTFPLLSSRGIFISEPCFLQQCAKLEDNLHWRIYLTLTFCFLPPQKSNLQNLSFLFGDKLYWILL